MRPVQCGLARRRRDGLLISRGGRGGGESRAAQLASLSLSLSLVKSRPERGRQGQHGRHPHVRHGDRADGHVYAEGIRLTTRSRDTCGGGGGGGRVSMARFNRSETILVLDDIQ